MIIASSKMGVGIFAFYIFTILIHLSTQQEEICRNSPCIHGTVCFNDAGEYECECDSGYIGSRCEKEEGCLDEPCVHGVACFNDYDGTKCNCYPGFYGVRCQYSDETPCSNISIRPHPILIQQHIGPTDFFKKNWAEMLVEQGSTSGDYWLGLLELRQILAEGNGRFRLRIEMNDTTNKNFVATYETFMIQTEQQNFTLDVGGFGGNVSFDALWYQRHMQFTTYDRDNDITPTSNDAEKRGGAFWHDTNSYSCLNCSPDNYFSDYGAGTLASSAMYIECKEEF